uniref:F-box domain-containing protein n=1 Tax=Anopheles atroparvus TaxID=41427 RepID=A0A182IQJ7_ANOAO
MDMDEMQLEMLPEEVLWMIMSWLPLDDLKSLTLTNKRLKALADRAIALRGNIYLCLNKRCPSLQPPRVTLKLIDPELVRQSHRQYRHLSIVLAREEVSRPLAAVLTSVLDNCSIKRLSINTNHSSTVAALLGIGNLSIGITNLKVVLMMKNNPLDNSEALSYMPALQTLSWLEYYRRNPCGPMNKLVMVAPQLRSLRQSTGNTSQPRTLILCEYGNPIERVRLNTGYKTLHKLVAVLNNEFLEALHKQVLPHLEYFECTIVTAAPPDFWRHLSVYMPNINHLTVRTVMDVWHGDAFAGCTQLRTLKLMGGQMSYSPGSRFAVPNLRQLCLVNCRLPDSQGTLQFPQLESLCLVASFRRSNQPGEQVWILPQLRNLCIEAPGSIGINIRQCQHLEYCRLSIKGRMLLLPWAMSLDNLTTLQVECRWSGCGDSLAQIFIRAPNLQRLMLLLQGCNVDTLVNLNQWCPQLRSVTIQAERRILTISREIMRVIFSLPAIEASRKNSGDTIA